MRALIIGTGLAGIAITERFAERKINVQIVSSTMQPSSTAIATGMYNPVVFRRLNLSWMIEELLPEMHEFYHSLEKKLGVNLNEAIDFAKRIQSDDYRILWEKRIQESPNDRFMGAIRDGYGPVLEAGMIDCGLLKASYEKYLIERSLLIDGTFDPTSIEFEDDKVITPFGAYDTIVFCEGPYAAQNPFFDWLPFNLCQGEWIIIKTATSLNERVINNKTNIIPLGDKTYKLSSTYSWKTLDWQPHTEASEELLQNFKEVHDVDFEIIDHQAALRPTVADRRPYLGRHPEYAQLAIFNGLGSKGVMLAPYFSKHLVDHLIDGKPLMEEVDIKRHEKRFRTRQLR